jgi:hypothetical protein
MPLDRSQLPLSKNPNVRPQEQNVEPGDAIKNTLFECWFEIANPKLGRKEVAFHLSVKHTPPIDSCYWAASDTHFFLLLIP